MDGFRRMSDYIPFSGSHPCVRLTPASPRGTKPASSPMVGKQKDACPPYASRSSVWKRACVIVRASSMAAMVVAFGAFTSNGKPRCVTTCLKNKRMPSLMLRPHSARSLAAASFSSGSMRVLTSVVLIEFSIMCLICDYNCHCSTFWQQPIRRKPHSIQTSFINPAVLHFTVESTQLHRLPTRNEIPSLRKWWASKKPVLSLSKGRLKTLRNPR